MNLTPKQLRILKIIQEGRERNGYSPTMQEIADEIGVSKVTVFEHVEALIEKGALRRTPHRARSLEVTKRFLQSESGAVRRLPLIGRIAAGLPIEAIENRDFLDLDEMFRVTGGESESETFALRVTGDSMIEDMIMDGDYVICERVSTAKDGDIVVALIEGGEATLKRIYREADHIRLQPANSNYEPIRVPTCEIQGVMIGLVRGTNH